MLEESAQRKGVSLTEEVDAYVTRLRNEREEDVAYIPLNKSVLHPYKRLVLRWGPSRVQCSAEAYGIMRGMQQWRRKTLSFSVSSAQ